MKKSLLLFVPALLAVQSAKSYSYDFSDKIYGKANFRIGYSLEHLQGDVLLENKEEKEYFGDNGQNNYLHNFSFNLGYNFYYKVNNLVHPFIGIEANARVPLKNKTRNITKQFNHASFDLKAGVKFNKIAKNISLQPYGVFGVAIMERNNDIDTVNKKMIDAGISEEYLFPSAMKHEKVAALNYGAGLDVIYDVNDKFGLIFGVGYKRVKALKKTKYTLFKLETDQVEFKLGVQF